MAATLFNEALYLKRYNNLNERQKLAVDTIYGPVMVIAGPGTGKTEVLGMRIANLLRSEAQVQPYEILCLTFTDEGSINMRRRLIEIIGEQAHRVHIYTFHAFCNSIIQSFPEYFGLRDLMPVSDLERMELIYEIIENLPDGNALKRYKGDLFYDAKNLAALFDMMKSEDWKPQHVEEAVKAYIKSLPEKEKFQYKRANKNKGIAAGDPKTKDIQEETGRMERTLAAANLFNEYQQKMQERGLYDFSDMILWVVNAFRDNPNFLQIQQERFQYILVDEFQDTGGAQSALLNMLADYWEAPNLFIVGDDDQSIFEFQGARLQNIMDFYERYKDSIKVIVLTQNYRSSQPILDRATASINHNEQRLIYQLKELNLDKNIIAANERFAAKDGFSPPIVRNYYNILHEEAHIVAQIEALQRQGVDLATVAVLYAQHKQAQNIIALLEKKGIPYWVKKPVNILDLPFTIQLLNILRYLQLESRASFSGEELLFQMMHTSFFEISPLDIASLSIYLQSKERKHKRWRFLLQDNLLLETLDLQNPKALYRLGQNLERWQATMAMLTIPMLLQDILYDGGIVAHILNGEKQIWDMQVLNTFFDFIKEECAKAPRMTVATLLQMIDKMYQEKIPISVQKVVKQANGVRFYTAFSAKGHEFEHVFVIGLTNNYWEAKRSRSNGFALPEELTKLIDDKEDGAKKNNEEVARRLFYVAMTRAKKALNISYAQADNAGKLLQPSMFINEICSPEEQQNHAEDDDSLIQHIAASLQPDPPVQIALAKKELIDKKLEQFVLSVSAMNSYLRCPIAFYYEYILRVPQAKSDALSFGIAVHFALEQLFKKMSASEDKSFPPKEDMIASFRYMMRKEESSFTELQYKRRLEFGEQILGEYYEQYVGTFNKIAITEYNISQVVVNGVPIKGKLDKIEFDGKTCTVIDYKTGDPDKAAGKELRAPNEENPDGGSYWRQMVFYKLLLDNFPAAKGWQMTDGVFDFIEKNKKGEYVRFHIPIFENDMTTLKQQIKQVHGRIMAHEFDTGCGEENCNWCRFAKDYELAKPQEQAELL